MNEERMTSKLSRDYRETKHKLQSVRWMLFFVIAIQTAVTLLSNLISSFFPQSPPVYLQMLFIELFAYILPISIYARNNRILTARDIREGFGLKEFPLKLLPLVVIAGIFCQLVMVVINLPVNLLTNVSDGYIPSSFLELIFAIFVLGIIPAIFEEFLLRGVVHGVMAELNTAAAAIFTSVLFALMHGSFAGFFGYLFMGFCLVFVLRRTGSLYACIIFHLANNVMALLLSYFSDALFWSPIETMKLFSVGLIIFGAVMGAITYMTDTPKKVRLIRTTEFLGQNFINLPVILCIAGVIWIMCM